MNKSNTETTDELEVIKEVDSLIREKAELLRFVALNAAWKRKLEKDLAKVNLRLEEIGQPGRANR